VGREPRRHLTWWTAVERLSFEAPQASIGANAFVVGSLTRHSPDDRLRWADTAIIGGDRQARTVVRDCWGPGPVTPGRFALGMAIWLSSRRTSPVVFAGMHDNRAPHTGAGSGGGRSSAISCRISANVPGMRDDLGADLHEFFPQARQRPLLDRLGQCQRPHEVAEIVGQRMKLKPDGVGGE
jgi:hypothetical protein